MRADYYPELPTDERTGSVRTLDHSTHEIQAGNGFLAIHQFTAVATGANRQIVIRVPAETVCHLQMNRWIGSSGPFVTRLYEGTTLTDPGTPVDYVEPMNRAEQRPPETSLTHTPTVGAAGEQLFVGDHEGDQNQSGVNYGLPQKWVLAPATDYLLEATNEGTAQIDRLSFRMFWYEASP